jgi:hypothetical protein
MMERDLHLADEKVEPWELRPLLDRLGGREFSMDERATLGTVADVTGHSLADVAHSLAELRRRELEERSPRVGPRLDQAERRLHDHEVRLQDVEARPVAYARPAVGRPLVGPYGRHVFKDRIDPAALMGIVVLVLLFLYVLPLLMSGSRSTRPEPPPGCTVQGAGGQRPCTSAEEAMFRIQRERGR